MLLVLPPLTRANNPPPVQIYYVPLPENQIFNALHSIFPGNAACGFIGVSEVQSPIATYISIATVTDNTVIYYDHWEDGFEMEISNPTQTTTEIWGDGDVSNGAPPNFPNDLIEAGDIIILDNPVDITTLQSVIDFDGGDKFASSAAVAVTRAAWATGPSTLLAGAVEVYDTNNWGTNFEVPVGEDIITNGLFEYTSLLIMAAEDDTVVNIDADNNGTTETTVTLDEGESHHVDGGVHVGATVVASKPVQVDMLTGDICATFESRWFTLFPVDQWSGSYYNPVGTPSDNATTVFLYNPGPNSITIEQETVGGLQAPISLLSGATSSVIMPDNSGAHFFTNDDAPFMAIAAVDSDDFGNTTHDWGFTLVPDPVLTRQALIGWGPGRDPTAPFPSGNEVFTNVPENGSPVWVMPVLSSGDSGLVDICIDFNGDGGPLIDSGGNGYDLLISLDEFESSRVYDPDGDQTGMLLYVCDNSEAKIAVVWGQDPATASPSEPAIDVGTTIPPLSLLTAGKEVEVINNAGNTATSGDTLLYTIVIQNISGVFIPNLMVSDTVPLHTEYVPDSTLFDNGITVTPIPDSVGLTPFPLDEGGVNLGIIPAKSTFKVSFQVTIDDPLSTDVDTIFNQAVVTAIDQEFTPEVETPLEFPTVITLVYFTARGNVDAVTLAWETATEIDNAGFNLYRASTVEGPYSKINPSLIPAEGDVVSGASYTYIDTNIVKGNPYYYKLEDVDFNGISTFHGPVLAIASGPRLYLPLIIK